ncbi:MAG: flavodoxin family protein [Eubacterium sp.]|jgi:multimeric flavodoxin WrbA
MGKKVIVIETSLRPCSNSDALAAEFARGAEETGNDVTVVSLKGKNINFCKGCNACQTTGKCVTSDDAAEILNAVRESDAVCFATPIYYYEMSGQMKTLLDRLNPLFAGDYNFRSVYMLMTGAEEADFVPTNAKNGLKGWVDCFDKASLAGTVFGGGAEAEGSIAGNKALAEAYEMGKSI